MRWVLCLMMAACSYDPTRTDPGAGDAVDAPVTPSKRIVFDNSTSDTDLLGFAVPLALDAATVDYQTITDPAKDLRFEDPEDSDLPFEIERWDPTGTSLVWVRVPTIDRASTTDSILMYTGPAANGHADPAAVWTGYRIVTHLGSHLENSASQMHAGTAVGATVDATGQLAEATRLQNPSDRLTFATGDQLFDGWPQFTLEFWIRLDYATSDLGGEPRVLTKGPAVNLARLFEVAPNVRHQIDWEFASTGSTFRGTNIPLQTWSHVVWTFDGQLLRIYRDGFQRDAEDLGQVDTLVTDTGDFELGNTDNAVRGAFDELRIAETARTTDEIRASYRAMTGMFATISDP